MDVLKIYDVEIYHNLRQDIQDVIETIVTTAKLEGKIVSERTTSGGIGIFFFDHIDYPVTLEFYILFNRENNTLRSIMEMHDGYHRTLDFTKKYGREYNGRVQFDIFIERMAKNLFGGGI